MNDGFGDRIWGSSHEFSAISQLVTSQHETVRHIDNDFCAICKARQEVRKLDVLVSVPVSKGDYLSCWPREIGSPTLEVAPFGPLHTYLAPLIALEDGNVGQTIQAIKAR